MGHEYVELKNTAAAIEAYRRGVAVNPRDYRAWWVCGALGGGLGKGGHSSFARWVSLRYPQPCSQTAPCTTHLSPLLKLPCTTNLPNPVLKLPPVQLISRLFSNCPVQHISPTMFSNCPLYNSSLASRAGNAKHTSRSTFLFEVTIEPC
jgi:hypothetical protein